MSYDIVEQVLAEAPALNGSFKQIAWAKDIRRQYLAYLAEQAQLVGLHPEGLRLALTRIVAAEVEARRWIESRRGLQSGGGLIRLATALATKGEIPDDVDYEEWLAAWRPRA